MGEKVKQVKPGKLTPKQHKFCELYMQTGNATEAYKGAYSAGKMKSSTVNKKASGLMQKGQIRARIEDIQAGAAERAELTKSWVLERLMRNVRICMGEEPIKLRLYSKKAGEIIEEDVHIRDATAANRALELLGKELKMFTDRQEVSGSLTLEQLVMASIARRDARAEATFAPGEKLAS